MSYLLSHWRGQLPLKLTLWVNVIGLLLFISYVELFFLSRLAADPIRLISFSLLSLLFTRLILFPWQLVGLLRATEQDFRDNGRILKTRSLQAFSILMVLFTLVYSLEVIQAAVYSKKQFEFYSEPPTQVDYTLEVSEDQRQLHITGALDIGITSATRSMLVAYPGISSVILQSPGGHIYEGRGLARLFMEYQLDTFVARECSSACVTAFIGGQRRYLGPAAKLGFHQYKLEKTHYLELLPVFDIPAEQLHDLALYKSRGVKPAFLDKIYVQPANMIWFPEHEELLEVQLVHAVISGL